MTKKKIWWIVSIVILAIIAILSVVWAFMLQRKYMKNRQTLELMYENAVYQASDNLNNVEMNLSKLLVSNGGQYSINLLQDICNQSNIAQVALSALPISDVSEEKISKFLGQLSDWSNCYQDRLILNNDTKNYKKQVEQLYILSRELNQDVKTLLDTIESGDFMKNLQDKQIFDESFEGLFNNANNQNIDYPALIYDGPFSDSKKVHYAYIENLKEIDDEYALKIAHDLLQLNDVQIVGQSTGDIETFEISGKKEDCSGYVSISKHGGMIINYSLDRNVDSVNMQQRSAQQKAVEGATKLGYPNMSPVWYNSYNGIGYVNLAPCKDGIIYYTDLVKVNVALDNGEVLGLESTSFCKCNHTRENLTPTIDSDTAKSIVGDNLAIKSCRLCIVPTQNDEVLTYEVNGEYKGLDYFVYVDAHDGAIVNVLRVVDDGEGSLTM